MKSEPTRENNAIDSVTFSLVFDKEFAEATIIGLRAMEAEFGEFDDFEEVNTTVMTVAGNAPKLPVTRPAGVSLTRKPKADDELSSGYLWNLQVSGNRIIVSCRLYDRWSTTWAKALDLFKRALRFIPLTDAENNVSEFALHVEDRFTFLDNHPSEYSMEDIFNADSDYFSRKIAKAGHLWHIHQGWFEDIEGFRLLNNVNIGTIAESGGTHVTLISHLIRVSKDGMRLGFEEVVSFLEQAAVKAHTVNSSVVSGLLNPEAKKRIGLS